jgi:hypothetical protein
MTSNTQPTALDKDLQRLLGPTRTAETILAMVTISEVVAPMAASVCWLRGGAGLYLWYLLTLIIAWVATLSGFICYPPPRRLEQVRWVPLLLSLTYLTNAGGMAGDSSTAKLVFLAITNYIVSYAAMASSTSRSKEQLHADVFARFPPDSPELPAAISLLKAMSDPAPSSTVDHPSEVVLTELIDALNARPPRVPDRSEISE